MKNISLPVIFAAAALSVASSCTKGQGGDVTDGYVMKLSVATYNVLHVESKAPWAPRKDAMNEMVHSLGTDVICFQECGYVPMIDDLQEMLKEDYEFHSIMPITEFDPALICWKKGKYSKVDGGYSYSLLGDTEYKYSEHGSSIAHWVKLKEVSSGKCFLVYDIHLKAGSEAATQKLRFHCMQGLCPAVIARAENDGRIPVIMAGDYNNYKTTVIDDYPSSPAVAESYGFVDPSTVAVNKINDGFKTSDVDMTGEKGAVQGSPIDYVYVYAFHGFTVPEHRIHINFVEGSDVRIQTPVPSDHHPVSATFELNY